MDFIDLKNVTRQDSLIHYINKYQAQLVYGYNGKISEEDINITLEKTAFGTTNISLDFPNKELIEYATEIEHFIHEKRQAGLFR